MNAKKLLGGSLVAFIGFLLILIAGLLPRSKS
jgi:hypothetical protein